MNKILSFVGSTVLALAALLTPHAQAQNYVKLSEHGAESSHRVKPGAARALNVPSARKTHHDATPSLKHAMRATGVRKAPQGQRATASDFPDLRGSVTYSYDDDTPKGLYRIGSDASLNLLYRGVTARAGGAALNGVYYCIDSFTLFGMEIVTVYLYDVETGEEITHFSGDEDNQYIDMAGDPTSGILYALGINAAGTSVQLLKVDITETSISNTVIGDLPGYWSALACDAAGQLYGIDQYSGDDLAEPGRLFKLDKLTAEPTLVGSTGMYPYYSCSATIDARSGRMFWTVCPLAPAGSEEESYLCEVNTATGAATLLGTFPAEEQVQGIFVKLPLAEPGAPDTATDLTATFTQGSLSGTLRFTAPATTFDGMPGTGALSYSVSIEGATIRSGAVQWGETLDVPVTLAASGEYTFSVAMSNAQGAGPAARTTAYVGMGVPATTVATLTYFEGRMQLSWTPVATTVGGTGFIDPAAVTYTVTRFPDDIVVNEGAATSFSEPVAEPATLTQYYYTVVARCGDVSGAAATSNAIALGSIRPPYSNTFDNDASLEGYTLIDANGDGTTWDVSGGHARMKYNSYIDMDDWMITPGIRLEGGKSYMVKFEVSTNMYDERVEARWGMQPTVAGMTETLVAPTLVAGDDYTYASLTLGDYIVPAVTGTYYIGIHGMSDADSYWLYVDNLSIAGAVSGGAPGLVTDFKALTDPDGAFSTTVSFKAPVVTQDGDALASITEITVRRGSETVKTFSGVQPGQDCSFVDEVGESGSVTYTAVASNEEGSGSPATTTTFVGIDAPAAPANITITESAAEPGVITVSWDAVSTDRNGQPINPSLVTYSLAAYEDSYGWVDFETGITGTSFTFRAVEEGDQQFVQYAVYSETSGGLNGAASEVAAVGTPYQGLDESFTDGTPAYEWAVDYASAGAKWVIYTDTSITGTTSFDADGGYAGMQSYVANGTASLISGKISLEGCTNPGFTFFTFGDLDQDHNTVEIYVREAGAAEWQKVCATVVSDVAALNEWGLVTVALDGYAGKTVQLRIAATTVTSYYTFIDRMHAGSLLDYDLAAGTITAPEYVKAGGAYTATVGVTNEGVKAVDAYTVEILADGSTVATRTMSGLAAGRTASVAFDLTMSAIATEPVELTAVVKYSGDANAANDATATGATVKPRVSTLPRVTDLAGEERDGVPALSWTEPDLTASGAPETVDFEDGESWAHEYEGWVFVDGDEAAVGGFDSATIPGVTPGSTTASFIVWDASDYNEKFEGHSGHKYLVAMYRYDDGPTDDWAISPELSGHAQAVTFWAKSYQSAYPEKIELYYSTGSVDPADFVKVGDTVEAVPGDWTEYTIEVPEGGRRFAVRSCATGSFLLMMDDFTFVPGTSADLSIAGYDVYRDGEKITPEPVGECEYDDANAPDGEHSYVVVTVYTIGTSAPSNAVTLTSSGIADAIDAGIMISSGKGTITVSGAEGKQLTVVAADGKLCFSGTAGARHTVAVPAGIYVVKAGRKIAKVAVK